jgi:hypothetical protein
MLSAFEADSPVFPRAAAALQISIPFPSLRSAEDDGSKLQAVGMNGLGVS